VVLYNSGDEDFLIHYRDRIAQTVLCPVFQAKFYLVDEDELNETERGDGGFGSTGM